MTAKDILNAKDNLYDLVLEEVSNSTANLKELDHWRTIEFPNELYDRYGKDELQITKPELQKLMDWKLKKGKFRPTLKKLIAQNEESDIISITKEAYSLFLSSAKDSKLSKDEYKQLVKKSMTILVKLRGVGPATASLLLSILNKITKTAPPFYSDEAAEYIFEKYGDQGEIKLKYSMSEYIKWLDLFWDLNGQYEYDFADLENGVWALKKNEYYEIKPKETNEGKEANGKGGGKDLPEKEKIENDEEDEQKRKKRKVVKK